MTELFVSYCRDDTAVMEPIVENLRKLGFDLWIDIEHLTPGTPAWTQAIDDALHRADGVLAFLSPAAKDSHWCNIETQRAQMFDKPVYPILVSGEPRTAVPIHLTGVQFADMRGRANREKNFERLVKTLSDELDHPAPEFDLQPGQSGMPVITNIIHVSGHVEGNVYALNVAGDVTGDVNVAGGDIQQVKEPTPQPAPSRPEPAFDALSVYRQAVEARQAGEHTTAIQLLDTLQREAPDLFPDQVTALLADSQARLEAQARHREYLRAYEHVVLLTLDDLTLENARQFWLELREAYPDIDHDPENLGEKLKTAPDVVNILDILPGPFEWCEIPAGRVTLEKNAGTFDVQPFFLAKYQTTYEQFQVFVDAEDGFTNDAWWQGLAKRESKPGKQCFTHAENLPRDSVSWYDAVAFCRWLSSKVGYEVRLPTEWEWQWAAQGPDGLVYPWGNKYIKGYANIDEKNSGIKDGEYLEKTTPVGSYPQGASPYGVLDMCGNVWEWCLNEYDNPGRTDTTGEARRVLRGGSWDASSNYVRAADRDWDNPYDAINDYGFRCALSSI
jgi:formylglycine-generating enzyme required for sulfatase activity